MMACILLTLIPMMIPHLFPLGNVKEPMRMELSRLAIQGISLWHPFLVLFVMSDHQTAYLKPLFAYVGRNALFRYTMSGLMMVYLYAMGMIVMTAESFLSLGSGLLPDRAAFVHWSHLVLDGILYIFLFSIITSKKHKTLQLLFPFLLVVIQMILDDLSIPSLYYLFPIRIPSVPETWLALPYKVCYHGLVWMVAMKKNTTETL